jgi:hypothetical protein
MRLLVRRDKEGRRNIVVKDLHLGSMVAHHKDMVKVHRKAILSKVLHKVINKALHKAINKVHHKAISKVHHKDINKAHHRDILKAHRLVNHSKEVKDGVQLQQLEQEELQPEVFSRICSAASLHKDNNGDHLSKHRLPMDTILICNKLHMLSLEKSLVWELEQPQLLVQEEVFLVECC